MILPFCYGQETKSIIAAKLFAHCLIGQKDLMSLIIRFP